MNYDERQAVIQQSKDLYSESLPLRIKAKRLIEEIYVITDEIADRRRQIFDGQKRSLPVEKVNRKMSLFLICLFLFSGIAYAQQDEQRELNNHEAAARSFSVSAPSDGCTMWFEGDFTDCCRQHDAAYLTGGDSWRTRLRADNRLFLCVAGKEGFWHLALAPVMWTGVRIFGSDLSPSSRENTVHKLFKRVFNLTKKTNRQSRRNQNRSNTDVK